MNCDHIFGPLEPFCFFREEEKHSYHCCSDISNVRIQSMSPQKTRETSSFFLLFFIECSVPYARSDLQDKCSLVDDELAYSFQKFGF